MRHPGVRPEILRPRPSRPLPSVLRSPMLRTAVFALRHVVPVVILAPLGHRTALRAIIFGYPPSGSAPIDFLSGDGGRRPAVQDSRERATRRLARDASTRARGGSRVKMSHAGAPEGFTFLSISDRLRACSCRTWVLSRHARDVAGRAGVSTSMHRRRPFVSKAPESPRGVDGPSRSESTCAMMRRAATVSWS